MRFTLSRTFRWVLLSLGLTTLVFAAPTPTPVRPPIPASANVTTSPTPVVAARPSAPEAPPRRLGYGDAVVLGLIEGVTEYLPISSTGHLILAGHFLNLDDERPLLDKDGKTIPGPEKDKDGNRKPYTLKEAVDSYSIIIQGGAIMAVVLLYWTDLLGMFYGLMGRNPKGLLVLRNLIIAFIPAAGIGFVAKKAIEEKLFSPGPVIFATFVGAFLMFGIERWRRRQPIFGTPENMQLHELTPKQSLTVGLLQCVALWPGTSRSMMTMLGGYVAGLSPKRAAEFSFLLGLLTLSAASGYKLLKNGSTMMKVLDVGPLLVGILVAGVSAALAVKWLVAMLTRFGLAPFAWYRIVLTVVMAVILFR